MIPPVCEPSSFEDRIYRYWEERGYFHANPFSGKPPFSMVIPPPNITGVLHMGHALNNTLQDIIARLKRMQGYEVLWMPGTDHAGIATQNVVERQLESEGITRQELGREEFVKRVWQWKEKYGGTIKEQLKRLGCSCDWERERFTMDEGCSLAVRTVFKMLYDDGLIYRGMYIINWCPRCHTALSDIEVEHEEKVGKLWYVKYPFEDGKGAVTVATTRPETMLGDTAVAVHPDDSRYADIVGKFVILPLVGRRIQVIADSYVDPEFGTGAVKVTPAHDPNDFEIGLRHDLERIIIMTSEAKIAENCGKYTGMDRYEAREEIIKDLENNGLLDKVEEHVHAVGKCYRCGTEIEPYLSTQWFVKMPPLAKPAIQAVRDGKTVFIPGRWEKIYFDWMENIRDWCISRQLWWGHRIPVWYCDACGEMIVEVDEPEKCRCGSSEIRQDPDVLDTWFSSGLWPFSTMGWPEKTPELQVFYPTSVLTTGFDIIFFWVARMMMLGIRFAGDVPFREVFVTALVRDYEGKKMSKSSGNVIDPIDIIEKYGTDALRFTLASIAVPGRDINLSEERIEGNRNFVNKIWNASRLVLSNIGDYEPSADDLEGKFELADLWILSRMSKTIEAVENALSEYNMSVACKAIHQFFWGEFCDWYLELAKLRFYGDNQEERKVAQAISYRILECSLRLLHPFMPYMTEELWQKMPGTQASIMIAPWPSAEDFPRDEDAEEVMSLIQSVIVGIRQARSEHGIPPSRKICAHLRGEEVAKEICEKNLSYILTLGGLSALSFMDSEPGKDFDLRAVAARGIEIFLSSGVGLESESEVSRLQKRLKKTLTELERVEKKLSNEEFLRNAPEWVIEKERKKQRELSSIMSKLTAQIENLRGS